MQTEKPKILIVDDAPENIMLLSDDLSDEYRLIIATSGAKACDLAILEKPDLILLDVVMPDMDGYEVCDNLMSNPLTKTIPVVFITSRDGVQDIVKGLALGAVDYIAKPFEKAIVKARIQTHLSLKWHRDQLQAAHDAIVAKSAERVSFFTKQLDKRTDFVQQMIALADATSHTNALFLTNMGYRVRSPSTLILEYCEMLLTRCTDNDESFGYISEIKKAALALARMSNNIIDITRLEAGDLQFQTDTFNVGIIAREIVASFSGCAASKGLNIILDISDSIPDKLNGDEARLRQVLTHLLDNALQYTPTGEVVLLASLIKKSHSSVRVRFLVRDTGIGMTPEQRDKLFGWFLQSDNLTMREEDTTGFGLILCNQLVEKMGGKMTVKSEPKKGSEFSFTITFQLVE